MSRTLVQGSIEQAAQLGIALTYGCSGRIIHPMRPAGIPGAGFQFAALDTRMWTNYSGASILPGTSGGPVIETKLAAIDTDAVVKSVGRVLEVFELMRSERRPMTGTEIGRALGFPKSSTNAILRSLVTLGYLSVDLGSVTYFPSLRLSQLGDWIPAAVLGSGQALNLIEELHIETQETVTLSMQNDLSMQFMHVSMGTFPIALQVNEGFVAPVFGTGVGTALLASKTDAEVLDLVERANAKIRRKRDRVIYEQVIEEVQTVRKQGYAAAYNRVIPDSGAIAIALPEAQSGITLVVAVAGLSARMKDNEKRILRLMRSAINRYY